MSYDTSFPLTCRRKIEMSLGVQSRDDTLIWQTHQWQNGMSA